MSKAIKSVRWGILGTARIARKVAAAMHATPTAELTAVASRKADRAAAWAAEQQVPYSYGSYEELLADEQIEAVYVPLPPSLHAEWSIKAAEAGKHVLCEKPLAMNAAEAEQIVAACARNQVQLMDATMWVHHPRARDMRRVLDESLGELLRVTSALTIDLERYLPRNPTHLAPSDASYSLAEAATWELRLRPDLGGGALGDLGWYCVRAILWTFGKLPQRVYGSANWFNDVDLRLSALLWFDDDRMASFDCGYDMAVRKWFEVTGTERSLVCDDFVGPNDPDRIRFWTHAPPEAAVEYQSTNLNQVQCMVQRFCEIVGSGTLDSYWPEVSLANQRVCDAILQSARSGEIVDVGVSSYTLSASPC